MKSSVAVLIGALSIISGPTDAADDQASLIFLQRASAFAPGAATGMVNINDRFFTTCTSKVAGGDAACFQAKCAENKGVWVTKLAFEYCMACREGEVVDKATNTCRGSR